MMYSNSFTSQDYLTAKEDFIRWQSKQHEELDEYLLRKRKAELCALVRKVIKQELTAQQRLLVQLHWYEGMSITEIAQRLNISKSTVSRRLTAINDIVYDKLKYAMEYRYGTQFSRKTKLIIKNADALMFHENPTDISGRIVKLRKQQCLSVPHVSELTGISSRRIEKLESDAGDLTAEEIRRLCLFYKIPSDHIIFGTGKYTDYLS